MEALKEIANKAIADYGFRQAVLYGADDIVAQWGLSDGEAQALRGPVLEALNALPIPVQPGDISREEERFARLIADALSGH
jgi:hypothetical protein